MPLSLPAEAPRVGRPYWPRDTKFDEMIGVMSKRVSDLHLEKEKLEIIKWVVTLKDRAVLDTLKMIKDNPKKIDWWHGVSEDEKKAIELRNLKLEE